MQTGAIRMYSNLSRYFFWRNLLILTGYRAEFTFAGGEKTVWCANPNETKKSSSNRFDKRTGTRESGIWVRRFNYFLLNFFYRFIRLFKCNSLIPLRQNNLVNEPTLKFFLNVSVRLDRCLPKHMTVGNR